MSHLELAIAWVRAVTGIDPARAHRNRTVAADTAKRVFVGVARDAARRHATPSFPELAEALERASHSTTHALYQSWRQWPERVRQAWIDEFKAWKDDTP